MGELEFCQVDVQRHGLGVLDREIGVFVMGDYPNGLVRALPIGALISTGIDSGPVRVAVEPRDAAPDTQDLGEWEDAAEISVLAAFGELRVSPLVGQPVRELGVLSAHGPATYRLRVCARGRDRQARRILALDEEPAEEYLISAWPDPVMRPDLILRATSSYGLSLRQSAISAPTEAGVGTQHARSEWEDRLRREEHLRAIAAAARKRAPLPGT